MESRARFLGHSIHQSLVAFPVGLLATAVILDLIAIFGRYPTAVVAAYWMMACGIVGALALVTAWLGGVPAASSSLRDEPPTASAQR